MEYIGYKFIKIIKINPINFNLKSNLEKEAILNSYKIFLKTCKFNIQILIQSNKEDLSKHISKIKNKIKDEKENIKLLSNNYINFIYFITNIYFIKSQTLFRTLQIKH